MRAVPFYNRRQLITTALGIGFARPSQALSTAAPPLHTPRLSGTFLQLLSEHRTWSEDRWKRLFDDFQRLQLSTVILQWVLSDGQPLYSSSPESPGPSVLQTILQRAEMADIAIMVGLVHDTDYWQRIAQPADKVTEYFADREARLARVVRAIAPLLRDHKSFAGWFINDEIDDINWRQPSAASVLYSYLQRVGDYLRLESPRAPVAISTFTNGSAAPDQLATFWQDLLRAAPAIRTVIFQDGVGARKLSLEQLPAYLCALRTATQAAGRTLWSVVELFEQTGGPPVDSGPFRARAAPFSRIMEQLRTDAACASDLIGFSAVDYLLAATPQAMELLYNYLHYIGAAGE
jgi:Domain of unknown function (DUF4434)